MNALPNLRAMNILDVLDERLAKIDESQEDETDTQMDTGGSEIGMVKTSGDRIDAAIVSGAVEKREVVVQAVDDGDQAGYIRSASSRSDIGPWAHGYEPIVTASTASRLWIPCMTLRLLSMFSAVTARQKIGC
jgi:hypothetical protein